MWVGAVRDLGGLVVWGLVGEQVARGVAHGLLGTELHQYFFWDLLEGGGVNFASLPPKLFYEKFSQFAFKNYTMHTKTRWYQKPLNHQWEGGDMSLPPNATPLQIDPRGEEGEEKK